MNEVFNLPYLDVSENNFQKKLLGMLINKYLFYFFLSVYSVILFNDFCTLRFDIYNAHINIILFISNVCFIIIFNICYRCVEQKKVVFSLFKNFWDNNYTYDYDFYEPNNLANIFKILIAVFLLIVMFLLSRILMCIPFFR